MIWLAKLLKRWHWWHDYGPWVVWKEGPVVRDYAMVMASVEEAQKAGNDSVLGHSCYQKRQCKNSNYLYTDHDVQTVKALP